MFKIPKYFYEISFEKPGGLVMPIIVDYTYSDGSTERVEYPVQVWRKNDDEVKKVVASDKEIVGIKNCKEYVVQNINCVMDSKNV